MLPMKKIHDIQNDPYVEDPFGDFINAAHASMIAAHYFSHEGNEVFVATIVDALRQLLDYHNDNKKACKE